MKQTGWADGDERFQRQLIFLIKPSIVGSATILKDCVHARTHKNLITRGNTGRQASVYPLIEKFDGRDTHDHTYTNTHAQFAHSHKHTHKVLPCLGKRLNICLPGRERNAKKQIGWSKFLFHVFARLLHLQSETWQAVYNMRLLPRLRCTFTTLSRVMNQRSKKAKERSNEAKNIDRVRKKIERMTQNYMNRDSAGLMNRLINLLPRNLSRESMAEQQKTLKGRQSEAGSERPGLICGKTRPGPSALYIKFLPISSYSFHMRPRRSSN